VSFDMRDAGDNALAHEKALYDGHAVAAVAATSVEIAREAARRVVVVYEKLAPVLTVDQAVAPGAPILHDDLVTKGRPLPGTSGPTNIAGRIELKRGDVGKGFAEADVVVEREFRTATVHQGYIEPHACVARVNPDGQVVVWCSTQGPFLVRDQCAAIL